MPSERTVPDRREAVILVRIDNMTTFATEGSRSIRFEIEPREGPINEQVAAALRLAPPVDQWQGF